MSITVEPRTLKEHIAMISIGCLLLVLSIVSSMVYLTTLYFLNCTCKFDNLKLIVGLRLSYHNIIDSKAAICTVNTTLCLFTCILWITVGSVVGYQQSRS